jgi:hypothetical protein
MYVSPTRSKRHVDSKNCFVNRVLRDPLAKQSAQWATLSYGLSRWGCEQKAGATALGSRRFTTPLRNQRRV